MFKIAVTSPSFSSNKTLRAELEKYFFEIKYNETGKNLSTNEMSNFVGDADGIILGLEIVDSTLLKRCKNLRVISKYGVGLNNIDLSSANAEGVKVVYSPGVNKRSVAELVLAFMLGISRNVFDSIDLMKKGSWVKNGGFEITGKNIGILGFGNVGKDLARLLKSFDVNIYANDKIDFNQNTSEYSVKKVSFDNLLKKSDILSIHVPYSEDCHHLISTAELSRMKNGSIIINTSRGGVVDEHALYEAILNKGVRVALDVFEVEPQILTELINHPNVYPTPHIGGNSKEAVLAMGRSAIENLISSLSLSKK
jgi:D-3-phosphoglycerate dehydrogenase